MTILIIIFLVILGLFLLLLEFVVIPGITIAGIGGVIMLIGSVYLGFTEYSVVGGLVTLLSILVTAPWMFYYFSGPGPGASWCWKPKLTERWRVLTPEASM